MRTIAQKRADILPSLLILSCILVFALSIPGVRAQTTTTGPGPYTQWDTVIVTSTTSGLNPFDYNFTWTNTNSCGSFSFGNAEDASWYYGPGVGATPCTSSLPSGTITETVSEGGVFVANCTDTDGAANYNATAAVRDGMAPGCTTAGTGVTIPQFWAQAYDAAGNPIASSGGNDDWIIAVVIVILILLVLFYLWRRRRKESGAGAQASPGVPGAPPASTQQAAGAGYCGKCGHALDPGAAFCRSCGARV